MTEVADIEQGIKALAISNAPGEERAVDRARQAAAGNEVTHRRWLRRLRGGAAGLTIVGLLALTPIGTSVADTVRDLFGGSSEYSDAAIEKDAEQGQAYFDGIYQAAIDKAEAGELEADVDPDYVIAVMTQQINPPADGHAANQLEEQVSELLAKLRAAGDLPVDGTAFPGP